MRLYRLFKIQAFTSNTAQTNFTNFKYVKLRFSGFKQFVLYLTLFFNMCNFSFVNVWLCQSQWPRGLRCRSRAARLLRSWVRVPPGAWMSVYCECCVLSGRGLCDELITRPEESYRLWCVVCDLEKQTS